ncbi:MAG: FAD-dependent oxidoreductase, partial [Anaerolineales bacterium]|nr:FAD-dependent oxidoreductase [Anaerolineales bacterium]
MPHQKYRVEVPTTDTWRAMVKCQAACPVLTDARGYVTAAARGDLELGYEIAHDPNPLSTICGRICGAPCEAACRRSDISPQAEPVAIRPIKRVLTERYGPEAEKTSNQLSDELHPATQVRVAAPFSANLQKQAAALTWPGQGAGSQYSPVRWSRQELKRLATSPGRQLGKVAVIGAGPSGLTVAHDLALLGHQVVIFEAGPKSGGMLRYGVPVYRIDQEDMDLEIESILDLGVEIRYNTPIGPEIKLADLRRDFDAVFLGIGLMQGRALNIEGANLDGVMTAVDLLLNYNLGYRVNLGQKVLIVGGGDVAVDAARTALRAGQLTAGQQTALANSEARAGEESETVSTALDVART